jgi:pyruvate dehydrogenase E2 component (dihydrolipoamide acetyltransferase)
VSEALADHQITMPRLSDSMEEAVIVSWLKEPGDAIAKGEPLVEIETDKATMVYEAELDGVLGELLAAEGDSVLLGAPIALVRTDAAPPPAPRPGNEDRPVEAESSSHPRPVPAPPPPPAGQGAARVRATPVARRVAAELGVELGALAGSGPGGRIVRKDVAAAAEASGRAPTAAPVASEDERVELSATQRTIARRMSASRGEIPDFTLTAEIDVTEVLAMRRELNAAVPAGRVSVNDMVVRAVALALREHPGLNASWGGDHIVRHARVNVGVAVATDDDALLVPTIADADRKSVLEIAAEARAAADRARRREIGAEELEGATFTVSNLGMFGVLAFDAVINPPQVAILAVGGSVRRPCFDAEDRVVARELMQLALCCDHRAVYGAAAARFLARVGELLERPLLLTLPPLGGDHGGER